MTVPAVLLAVFVALLLFALTRRGPERGVLISTSLMQALLAGSQVTMKRWPVLGITLMSAGLVVMVVGIVRMRSAARKAAFTALRAPLVMAAGAILCLVVAELLPDKSPWMDPVLGLLVILTAGFIGVGLYRVTTAAVAARARLRQEASNG